MPANFETQTMAGTGFTKFFVMVALAALTERENAPIKKMPLAYVAPQLGVAVSDMKVLNRQARQVLSGLCHQRFGQECCSHHHDCQEL